jgi:uncharacterized protein (DUF1697 family)
MLQMKQIAFLRGINLGSARRVSMTELRTLLESLGYEGVRTHLQSGNVVLESRSSSRRLEQDIEKAIAAELGVETQVAVRTREELADVIARDPLGDVVDDPARYQVSFLSAKPAAKVVRELAAEDVAPELFVVSGREIYAWHPEVEARQAALRAPAGRQRDRPELEHRDQTPRARRRVACP